MNSDIEPTSIEKTELWNYIKKESENTYSFVKYKKDKNGISKDENGNLVLLSNIGNVIAVKPYEYWENILRTYLHFNETEGYIDIIRNGIIKEKDTRIYCDNRIKSSSLILPYLKIPFIKSIKR